ncbi:MAG: hypothetical protein LBR13_04640 [Dysgonamonadaceae bacterium]|jgi:hypothetical protein|nr:hypothetical protein [Dysgonamonadaceae bacterium]
MKKITKLAGRILAIYLFALISPACAQFVGTPYIVSSTPMKIVCDSVLQYNNGRVLHPGHTEPGYPSSVQELYVKVYSNASVYASSIKATLLGYSPEAGYLYFETLSPFTLNAGYSWVKLVLKDGTVPPRGIYPFIWTLDDSENILYENGNYADCAALGVESNFGDMSIIFADNDGSTRLNWGPDESNTTWDGKLEHSARSAAILGPARQMIGNEAAGGENFDNTPTATVNVNFKVYGGTNNFKFTISVGGAILGSTPDCQQVWNAVNGKDTYGGEIPDIIIHARENIGNPANNDNAKLLLNAYHQHVQQGGWLIYCAREGWGGGLQDGRNHTRYLLDSLGIGFIPQTGSSAVNGIGQYESVDPLVITATAGTPAYELIEGYAPFGGVLGQNFILEDSYNKNCPTVRLNDPDAYPFVTDSNGDALAFVCQKSGWKGGFIYLAVGTRADVTTNTTTWPAMFSAPSWASSGWSANNTWPANPSDDGFRPVSTNSKLEMNSLAFVIEMNRAADINMPEKPVAPLLVNP